MSTTEISVIAAVGFPLVVAFLIYVVGPVAIRFVYSQPVHQKFVRIRREELPAEVSEPLGRTAENLDRLGFTSAACFGLVQEYAGSIMELYLNRSAGDMAKAVTPYQRVGEAYKPIPASSYVEFCTEFPDPLEIETNNLGTPSPFPSKVIPEHVKIVRLPSVDDLADLYRIHRALVDHVAPGREGTLPAPGEESEYFSTSFDKTTARLAEVGCMYVDPAADVYRPTWKGAFAMTWRSVWPLTRILKACMRKEAERILMELGETFPGGKEIRS